MKHVGVKMRSWVHLPSHRPLVQEVLSWAAKVGGDGGMPAVAVADWRSDVRSCLETDTSPLPVLDQNDVAQGAQDYTSTLWRPKQAKRTRSSASWSAPTKLMVMTLSPAYVSSRCLRQQGLGARSLEDLTLDCKPAGEELRRILAGVRRCRQGPTGATFSHGCLLHEHNPKRGMAALRLIHLACSYWKRTSMASWATAGGRAQC